MKNLKKFVCNLDVIISGLSLCAIVVITLAGVIMRKIMNQPIAWLEEMQLLLFMRFSSAEAWHSVTETR